MTQRLPIENDKLIKGLHIPTADKINQIAINLNQQPPKLSLPAAKITRKKSVNQVKQKPRGRPTTSGYPGNIALV